MTERISALYWGWVRHRRFTPKLHRFRYRVFMAYLDLDELDEVLSLTPLWSAKRLAPARFKRSDFHGDPHTPLKDALQQTIAQRTGVQHDGPIRMLVNLRYFGYNMNPLCTYYCFDRDGVHLKFIVAEVNNTPWGEKHAYVLQCDAAGDKQTFKFEKAFHVSPFNPLNMQYRWLSNAPEENLIIHLENWQEDVKTSDATLRLQRHPLDRRAMNRMLIRYPFMTVKVIASIYYQAVRLWLKKVPYFAHPKNQPKNHTICDRGKGSAP